MQTNWQGYLDALSKQKLPKTSNNPTKPFPTTQGNTTSTGFIEWKATQPKNDPMSLNWEGIHSSEKNSSKYKSEFMSVDNK